MAEWKKFTGNGRQLEEIYYLHNDCIVRLKDGSEYIIYGHQKKGRVKFNFNVNDIYEYLICEPHPHAEMIKRWADTGQPVYLFDEYEDKWKLATAPTWSPSVEYSFNPPKEKQFIEVRDYLWRSFADKISKFTANKGIDDIHYLELNSKFIRWLDDDWRKIEI